MRAKSSGASSAGLTSISEAAVGNASTSTQDGLDFASALGKGSTVTLTTQDDQKRYFHGVMTEARWAGSQEDLYIYQIVLRPWLWLLTRTSDCISEGRNGRRTFPRPAARQADDAARRKRARSHAVQRNRGPERIVRDPCRGKIFAQKSPIDIIKQVFADRGFSDFRDATTGSPPTLEYCVQYRETDFNFVCRLMEAYGVYYFFEHEDGKHTLVLADAKSSHHPVPGLSSLPYNPTADAGRREKQYLRTWSLGRKDFAQT